MNQLTEKEEDCIRKMSMKYNINWRRAELMYFNRQKILEDFK